MVMFNQLSAIVPSPYERQFMLKMTSWGPPPGQSVEAF